MLVGAKRKTRRIVVTGHSLGAAQAAVFGSLLARGVLAKRGLEKHTTVEGSPVEIFVSGFSTPPILVPAVRWSENHEHAYNAFVQAMVDKAGLSPRNCKNFIVGTDVVPRIGAIAFELLKFEGLGAKVKQLTQNVKKGLDGFRKILQAWGVGADFKWLRAGGKLNHLIHPGGDYVLLSPGNARGIFTINLGNPR